MQLTGKLDLTKTPFEASFTRDAELVALSSVELTGFMFGASTTVKGLASPQVTDTERTWKLKSDDGTTAVFVQA